MFDPRTRNGLLLCFTILAMTHSSSAVAQGEEGEASSPVLDSDASDAPAERMRWRDRLGFGAKLGLSLSTFSGEDADRESSTYAYKPRPTIGAFVCVDLHPWISIQSEILFVSKGPDIERDGMVSDTFNVRYIEIPLLAHLTLPLEGRISPYLLAGPSLGFLLSAKLEDHNNGSVTDRTDLANSVDLGVLAGVGAKLALAGPHVLMIEGRYDQGLATISQVDDEDLKNRVVSIVLGYQYSLSGRSPSGSPAVAEQAVNED